MYWYDSMGTLKCVLYREVFFYCVLYSECPLSEVLLCIIYLAHKAHYEVANSMLYQQNLILYK